MKEKNWLQAITGHHTLISHEKKKISSGLHAKFKPST
jgi:hypothetical protein